jgi:hypothetical protein
MVSPRACGSTPPPAGSTACRSSSRALAAKACSKSIEYHGEPIVGVEAYRSDLPGVPRRTSIGRTRNSSRSSGIGVSQKAASGPLEHLILLELPRPQSARLGQPHSVGSAFACPIPSLRASATMPNVSVVLLATEDR